MPTTCFNPLHLWIYLTTKFGLHPLPNSRSSSEQFSSETNRYTSLETAENATMESWSMIIESKEVRTDLSQLFLGKLLATGAHSRVYKGIYEEKDVALKMMEIPIHKEKTMVKLEEQFMSEVDLLSRLFHPNIVKFIAACKKPQIYCIITEYIPQGNLRTYLNKNHTNPFSIETVLSMSLDIAKGMEYLHSMGIRHRDLKSENLLLDDDMRVKIADFGSSCLEMKCKDKGKGIVGTYRWMAPEMIRKKICTRKCDVYSFGIVLWELVTALLPFGCLEAYQAAFAVANMKKRPPLPASSHPALDLLIKRCWSENPAERPEFSNIVVVLEKYKECINNGSSITTHESLRKTKNVILNRFKCCVASAGSPSSPSVRAYALLESSSG